MKEYDKTMNTLSEMRSRYDSGFSVSDRELIKHYYSILLGKRVRNVGCSDCYRDAYVEITLYLKRLGKMPKKPNYILKPGFVIHPRGTSKFHAGYNVPDEVAENYLADTPNNIIQFSAYPSDWEKRVEERKSGRPVVEDEESLKAIIADKNAEIEAQKAKIVELEEANARLLSEKKEFQKELEALKVKQTASVKTEEKKSDETEEKKTTK